MSSKTTRKHASQYINKLPCLTYSFHRSGRVVKLQCTTRFEQEKIVNGTHISSFQQSTPKTSTHNIYESCKSFTDHNKRGSNKPAT
mmetsp:Transcript_15793/g.23185  ORF Transcript_15793/g.23185 Transcript_15793/m.23185 type:complete len:86 (+) Transcript_15793:261-518(+)